MTLDAEAVIRKAANNLVTHGIHLTWQHPTPVDDGALSVGRAGMGFLVGIPRDRGLYAPHTGAPALLVTTIREEGRQIGIAAAITSWGAPEPTAIFDADIQSPSAAMILLSQWGLRQAAQQQVNTN